MSRFNAFLDTCVLVRVVAALRAQIQGSRRPALSEGDVLGRLRRTGLPEFAEEVARHL